MPAPLLDPSDHLDAVRRSVRTTPREGEDLRRVSLLRTLAAQPEEAWESLTDPERIERWLAPVSGELEPGGRFDVEGNAGGEVLRCDRPEHLRLTWEHEDRVTWVDVSLRPTDGGTLLQLDHDVPTDDHWETYGPGAVGVGWEMALMGLVLHLGDPSAPRPSPDELGDLEGFVRSASSAWAEARIEDGDDEQAARDAEARCTAAYLGA